MKNIFTLPGDPVSAHIAWSSRADGPMNLTGREFPIPPAPIPGLEEVISLNLKGEAGDRERLANRAAFLSALSIQQPPLICVPKLVHGATVLYVDRSNEFVEDLTCDGLMTEKRNLALSVGFADCPPVVLFDAETRLLVVLHAGWKGIVAGILDRAVDSMIQFGAHRSQIQAFIGPGARGCCYEMSPQDATAVDGLVHHGHVKVDLPKIIAFRLGARGIQQVSDEQPCTICSTVDSKDGSKKPAFFSYRREKKNNPLDAGVLAAWIQ